MKKKIIALAIAAIALTSVNSFAQDNKAEKACPNQEQCPMMKGQKGEKANKPCPFEGLNLTDAQKQQLQALQAKQVETMKANREAMKAQKETQKEAKKADREQAKKARLEMKQNYLKELKSILGQEKYIQFLENSFIDGSNQGPRMGQMKKDGKGPKGQKEMQGPRQGKAPKKDFQKAEKK